MVPGTFWAGEKIAVAVSVVLSIGAVAVPSRQLVVDSLILKHSNLIACSRDLFKFVELILVERRVSFTIPAPRWYGQMLPSPPRGSLQHFRVFFNDQP